MPIFCLSLYVLFLLFFSCYSLCDPVKHDSQYYDGNPPFESHAYLHLGNTFQYYFPQTSG